MERGWSVYLPCTETRFLQQLLHDCFIDQDQDVPAGKQISSKLTRIKEMCKQNVRTWDVSGRFLVMQWTNNIMDYYLYQAIWRSNKSVYLIVWQKYPDANNIIKILYGLYSKMAAKELKLQFPWFVSCLANE